MIASIRTNYGVAPVHDIHICCLGVIVELVRALWPLLLVTMIVTLGGCASNAVRMSLWVRA